MEFSLRPLLTILVVPVAELWLADAQLIRNKKLAERHPLSTQLGMIALSIVAAIAVVLSRPVHESLRGLLGLVITAWVAFSSPTLSPIAWSA